LSQSGDAAGHLAVLHAILAALEDLQTPGETVHLPFEWINDGKPNPREKLEEPPIVKYILRYP